MIDVLDNINDYKVTYKFSENFREEIQQLNTVDILFFYGMLKTSPNFDVKFLYPLNKKLAIFIRLVIFGIIDYKEFKDIQDKQIDVDKFCDWLLHKRFYAKYLILIWILNKKKEIALNSFFYDETNSIHINLIEEEKKNNIDRYTEGMFLEKLDVRKFKNSPIGRIYLPKVQIKRMLNILSSALLINVYDVPINKTKSMYKENTRTKEVFKLNRQFGLIEKRFIKENWLF